MENGSNANRESRRKIVASASSFQRDLTPILGTTQVARRATPVLPRRKEKGRAFTQALACLAPRQDLTLRSRFLPNEVDVKGSFCRNSINAARTHPATVARRSQTGIARLFKDSIDNSNAVAVCNPRDHWTSAREVAAATESSDADSASAAPQNTRGS
jgi:hypothetical protein